MWHLFLCFLIAGWSSPVARQAHNLKVLGSNPSPAPRVCPSDSISSLLRFQVVVSCLKVSISIKSLYGGYLRDLIIVDYVSILFMRFPCLWILCNTVWLFVKFLRLWVLHNAVLFFKIGSRQFIFFVKNFH